MTLYGCPQCRSTDQLGTLEENIAVSFIDKVYDADGDRQVDYTGETDYSGIRITVGICCQKCGWHVLDPSDDILSLLVEVEDAK